MTTTAAHLRTVALHWNDLRDALGQPAIHHGFGIGLRGHLAALNEPDMDLLARARADERADSSPDAPGERPVPIRLHILDTMNTVEQALIDCADQTAAIIQRSPMAGAPRSWPAADRERRNQLALADAADPRRWKYTGRRTAPYAALWLLARVEHRGGPFTLLPQREAARISAVAADSANRIERALDIAAQQRTLEQRHEECGGTIEIHGGAGAKPLGHCTKCGRVWAEGVIAAA